MIIQTVSTTNMLEIVDVQGFKSRLEGLGSIACDNYFNEQDYSRQFVIIKRSVWDSFFVGLADASDTIQTMTSASLPGSLPSSSQTDPSIQG